MNHHCCKKQPHLKSPVLGAPSELQKRKLIIEGLGNLPFTTSLVRETGSKQVYVTLKLQINIRDVKYIISPIFKNSALLEYIPIYELTCCGELLLHYNGRVW